MKSANASPVGLLAKRILDLLGSLILLCFLLPFTGAIAALIHCDTRGSILFRQQRLGAGGQPFELWKFRTLLEGSGARTHDRLLANDPRVTSVGKFLRSWGIDELPQLWNVLKG